MSLQLKVSEDAWQGDAQFKVFVDNAQVGGIQTATALHKSGASQTVDLGPVAAGPHTVSVEFVNDAWGGTPATDRNLIVDGGTNDGTAIAGSAFELDMNGRQSFSFTAAAPAVVPAPAAVSGTQAFQDNSGHTWSILNGQVAADGKVDAATNRVIVIGEDAKGTIWQENTDNLWWSTSGPNAAWGPAGGTATAPTLVTPGSVAAPAPAPAPSSTLAPAPAPASTPAASGAGGFHVANGQILDANGHNFIAKGINIFAGQADAATVISEFPGINFVRFATTPGADQNTINGLVNDFTSKGVAVEIDQHASSGSEQNTKSGQALTDEANWFGKEAGIFQPNNLVTFGMPNEPDNFTDKSAIITEQRVCYDAIRNAGSNALVFLEEEGGANPAATLQNPGPISTMRNVAYDSHFYGLGVPGNSSDPAVIAKAISDQAAAIQQAQSADGKMPVAFLEYGPSTSGSGYDPNGLATVKAIGDSGYGSAAWAYSAGADTLISSGTTKTDFGNLVAQHIAA